MTVILENGLYGGISGGTGFDDQNSIKCVGVTINGTDDYALDSVKINCVKISGDPDATVKIYLDDGTNTPSDLVATLNTQDITAPTGTVYTFTPSGEVILQHGVDYWISVEDGPGVGEFTWYRNSVNTLPTGDSATCGGYTYSNNGGAFSSSSVYNIVQINGTVQESPATFLSAWTQRNRTVL